MTKVGISVAEFCEMAPFQRTATFAMIKSGRLASTKVGGRRVINYESAVKLISPSCEECTR